MSDSTFQFDETAHIGDDHPVVITFYDEDSDGNLTPEVISDRDWFYTAKVSPSDLDADALIALDNIVADADPDLTLNPSALINRLSFYLPKTSTINATVRNYGQDLQSVETASGRVFTKGEGTLTMKAQQTIRTS
jgi:hypothetical protein